MAMGNAHCRNNTLRGLKWQSTPARGVNAMSGAGIAEHVLLIGSDNTQLWIDPASAAEDLAASFIDQWFRSCRPFTRCRSSLCMFRTHPAGRQDGSSKGG